MGAATLWQRPFFVGFLIRERMENCRSEQCSPLHPFIKSTVGRGLDPSLRFGGYVRLHGRIWNPPLRKPSILPSREIVRGVEDAAPYEPLIE